VHELIECPWSYWYEPYRHCSASLHAVLEEIRTSDHLISAEVRINKTCKEWDKTNACYQQLIQRCTHDKKALQELRIHIGRYIIYSQPCKDPVGLIANTADCFKPDTSSTQTCTDAIEKYLKKFINRKDFRMACRVVSMALKCYHDIKQNVDHRCGPDGANRYHQNYIQPLVEQTREVVSAHCSLSSPYSDYFLTSSSSSSYSSESALIMATPYGFYLATWCAFHTLIYERLT
jgi:hypothetical protein